MFTQALLCTLVIKTHQKLVIQVDLMICWISPYFILVEIDGQFIYWELGMPLGLKSIQEHSVMFDMLGLFESHGLH